jgi:hypothetical protein
VSARLALLAALGLVAGCGRGGTASGGGQAQAPEARAVADDGKVDCATGGADTFLHVCAIERSGSAVTIFSPSGGFRRLRIGTGGAIAAADGAEPARTNALAGGTVEIAIGGDRFRLKRAALR